MSSYAERLPRLEQVSAIDLGFPYVFLNRPMTRWVTIGDLKVRGAESASPRVGWWLTGGATISLAPIRGTECSAVCRGCGARPNRHRT
ncbi:hypothetical protein [Nocardia australiensis]|uniref:hypothetical protein n=1 Tax=Nocardia australiensis TaxID=2887191 RepID=UPI001D13D35D|nr:hypothetical protein [Nocardia australiensis]